MAFIDIFDGKTDTTVTLGKEGSPTSVEGYFLGTKETKSDYGPGKLHIFQTKTGTVGVWGKTRLNNLLTDNLRGIMLRVTFTGMVQPSKKGMRPSYGFKVQQDPDNRIDASNIDVNVETQESEGDVDVEAYESVQEEQYVAPKAPAKPAVVSSDRQAKIQALLNSKK